VCCESCVLSKRGLYDRPISRPEKSTMCDVFDCYLETTTISRPSPTSAVEP
jgi:hypothetical protein